MEDNSADCACSSNFKENLKQFIKAWESCPEIWNSSCDAYRDKLKKNKALDKLLSIYKHVKPDCTRYDVRKKLNSLRTNFRREWKKVVRTKSSGGDVYVPTNWTYYELLFLTSSFEEPDYEQPVQQSQDNNEDYADNSEWNDVDKYSESSMDPLTSPPAIKRTKTSNDQETAIDNEDSDNQQEEYHIARVWARKLKKLEPTQRLFAEKAINDILFEAQLQNLRYNKEDFQLQ